MMLLNAKLIDSNLLSQQDSGCRGGRVILAMAYLHIWCLAHLRKQWRVVAEVNKGKGHKSGASVYKIFAKAVVAIPASDDGNNVSSWRGMAVLINKGAIFESLVVLNNSKSLSLTADQNSSARSKGYLILAEVLHRKELTESLLTIGIHSTSARTKNYIQWFSICNAKQ